MHIKTINDMIQELQKEFDEENVQPLLKSLPETDPNLISPDKRQTLEKILSLSGFAEHWPIEIKAELEEYLDKLRTLI